MSTEAQTKQRPNADVMADAVKLLRLYEVMNDEGRAFLGREITAAHEKQRGQLFETEATSI